MTGCVYKVPPGAHPCLRDVDIKSRGLCRHHYQRAYHRNELDDYPRTERDARSRLDDTIAVKVTGTMADEVAAIVKARRKRGISERKGGNVSGVVRELVRAGLDSGTVT
jgi:hypothetical protein